MVMGVFSSPCIHAGDPTMFSCSFISLTTNMKSRVKK
jgi:hypothetical protein